MLSRIPPVLAFLFVVLALVLISARHARADALPGGITCEHVVAYAQLLRIPNTHWGRAQARIIAATFGIVLTGAQLDAAARCIESRGGR